MWTSSDSSMWLPPPLAVASASPEEQRTFLPVSWSESADAHELTIELDGFRRRDICVEVGDGTLDVRARKTKGLLSKEERAIRHTLTVPAGADADSIRASFRGGRLLVHVRKRPEARRRTIPIRVDGRLPDSVAKPASACGWAARVLAKARTSFQGRNEGHERPVRTPQVGAR